MSAVGRREFLACATAATTVALLPPTAGYTSGLQVANMAIALFDGRYASAEQFSRATAVFAGNVQPIDPDLVVQWHRSLHDQIRGARPRIYALGAHSDLQVLRLLTRPLGYRLQLHALHTGGDVPRCRLLAGSEHGCGAWQLSMREVLGRHPRNVDIHSWVLAT